MDGVDGTVVGKEKEQEEMERRGVMNEVCE